MSNSRSIFEYFDDKIISEFTSIAMTLLSLVYSLTILITKLFTYFNKICTFQYMEVSFFLYKLFNNMFL